MKIFHKSRFPIQTSEARLVWKLTTTQRTKARQYPRESTDKQQQPVAPITFDDMAIFDFLRDHKGNTDIQKWEKFSAGKNPVELYKELFEGAGAKLNDKVPTTHSGTTELYFFKTSAGNDPERSLRMLELRDAFINRERQKEQTAALRFDDDIQKYLDSLPNTEAWLKNPYLWFNPDDGETVDQRIERVYNALFGDTGPLKENSDKRTPAEKSARPSVEKMVFGKGAVNIEDKRIRLEVWQKYLNDRQAQRLETTKALDEVRPGKTTAEINNFFENISDSFGEAEGMEKVFMILGVVATIRMLYVDYKMATDANYREGRSTFGVLLDNVAGVLGIAHLAATGTNDRFDLFDKLRLTSPLDDVTLTGMKEVLKKMNLRDRPHVQAMLMLGVADLGKTFDMYIEKRTETDPKKQMLSINKLTNGKARATSSVKDRDAFIVAHTVFEEYGNRYFKIATGVDARTASERMMGAKLFVEYHKFSGAGPSLASALLREENNVKDPKEFTTKFKNHEGLLLRFIETAKALIQAPIHPILTAEYLGKNIQWAAEQIGIDVNWFDHSIDGALRNELERLYRKGSPKVKTYLREIKKFATTEWADFMKDKQGYIKDITNSSITFVLEFGGDAVEFVYDIGSGAVLGGVEVIDQFSIRNFGGKPILDTPFIPYWYDTATNTWQFGTLRQAGNLAKAGAKGAGNLAADAAGYTLAWGTEAVKATGGGIYEIGKGALKYTKDEAIHRWNTVFKPKLKSWGIKDLESLGAAGPKMVVWCGDWLIDQSIDKGGRFLNFSGRQIGDVYDASERLFWAMGVALKKKARWTEKEFKEYLQEWANKQPGIDEFNNIVVDKASEKNYFSGKPAKKALEELLPKARDWLFTRFSWWNIDVDAESVTIDESDMSITFNNFTVERTGIHTEIQGIDYSLLRNSAECSLKINFDKNGLSASKKRFVLSYIPRGHTKKEVKQLGLADLSNHEFLKNIVNTPLPPKPKPKPATPPPPAPKAPIIGNVNLHLGGSGGKGGSGGPTKIHVSPTPTPAAKTTHPASAPAAKSSTKP